MNAGSSVQQFRGLTYGMMGAGMGGGGSGQGAGGGGVPATKVASDVTVASGGGNLDTGQPGSRFAQPVSNLATAYLTSDQSKVPVTTGTTTTTEQGTAGGGGSIGGVTTGGGSTTPLTTSGVMDRYEPPTKPAVKEVAVTRENEKS